MNINCDESDFGFLVVSAVRYALPRRTYAGSIIRKLVLDNINLLSKNDLRVIISDIESANRFSGGLGDDSIDKPCWLELKETLLNKVK